MARAKTILMFKGLNTAAEPHLLADGELQDALNVVAPRGSLQKRRGWTRVLDVNLDPGDYSNWPNLIYSFDPTGGGDDIPVPDGNGDPDPIDPGTGGGGGGLVIPDGGGGGGVNIPGTDPSLTKPRLVTVLPAVVYRHVFFEMSAACTDTDYDGAGAIGAAILWDDNGGAAAAGLVDGAGEPADWTTGWVAGESAKTLEITGDVWQQLWAVVRRNSADMYAVPDRAEVREPWFGVALPDTGVLAENVACVITCRDADGGTALTGYDGAGAHVGVVAYGWDESAEDWVEIDPPTDSNGDPLDFTSGWTSGAWAHNIKFADTDGYERVKLVATWSSMPQGADEILLDVGANAHFHVELPATVNENEPFTLTITAKDGADNTITDYDPVADGVVLRLEAYNADGWCVFAGLLDGNGLALDISAGWVDGVWTCETCIITDVSDYAQLRATMVRESVDQGNDTADLVGALSLVHAIKERQLAYGITTAWDAGSPTNTGKLIEDTGAYSYSLTQLKAYVNAIAPAYVSGSYTGGADAPTMLGATYADTANSDTELLALVKAMLETKLTVTVASDRENQGSGSCPNAADAETAIETAQADYGFDPADNLYYREVVSIYTGLGIGYWQAYLTAHMYDYACSMPSALACEPKLYAKAQKPHAKLIYQLTSFHFDKQGYAVPNEDNYGIVATGTTEKRSTYVFNMFGVGELPMPTEWNEWGGETGYEGSSTGFRLTDFFAVMEWEFSFV